MKFEQLDAMVKGRTEGKWYVEIDPDFEDCQVMAPRTSKRPPAELFVTNEANARPIVAVMELSEDLLNVYQQAVQLSKVWKKLTGMSDSVLTINVNGTEYNLKLLAELDTALAAVEHKLENLE